MYHMFTVHLAVLAYISCYIPYLFCHIFVICLRQFTECQWVTMTTWQAASGTEFLNSSESTTVALQGTVTGTANVPVLANQPDLEAGAALSAWNRAAQCMPVPLPSADSLSLPGLRRPC